MKKHIFRLYVEKKPNFNVESEKLLHDIRNTLGISRLENVRIINRYDICGITEEIYEMAKKTIFSEATVDYIYDENIHISENDKFFAVEYLPGQYDQRADSAAQCIQILTHEARPVIRSARLIILKGDISEDEFNRIKNYYINPVDSREASMDKPCSIDMNSEFVNDIEIIDNFIEMDRYELELVLEKNNLVMSFEDLQFCQKYFREEKRNPTITELKVIDTYWSDHCRHTTFQTVLENINFEDKALNNPIRKAYNEYLSSRKFVYGERHKDICLMDIATIGMKELRKRGLLDDLDVSDEINACSIVIDVNVDERTEKWLLMFKNETHNHPTEIEPFGGASTCLGGAIRDPLSGRSYVYQAMRVTGSADPRKKIDETLQGKLPQVKITKEAARGYSSYGNQIGLATGHVSEIYHEGYMAKRMEVGAVVAAAPYENVIRETPKSGDVIILLGGRTGRDGIGGASGSSKEHDENSLISCGAEVQKGNAPTERKIQRLFRKPEVTKLIKKCNDFGAGGVSVAIGELADGLEIDLDLVPKKYDGLDGTELAISESQERMAVVVSCENSERFIKYANDENLEAVVVAKVTNDRRMKMMWRGNNIVDIKRDFLDTNGVKQKRNVFVKAPNEDKSYFASELVLLNKNESAQVKTKWISNLMDLNVCSQKGLVEMFDSTIGAGTVLMPFGGKYQTTPTEVMAAKIPVIEGETTTASLMSYGYNPYISEWSPFHGAVYAVVESIAKITAAGGDFRKIRLTFQEYFEKLGYDDVKWGKPFSALLGALHVQKQFNIPAIGGKDSMSGTFKDLNVPPTLVSFAVCVEKADNIISPEFKSSVSKVIMIKADRDEYELPEFEQLKKNYLKIHELIKRGMITAAYTVKTGGIAEAITKMCFGNKIGFEFENGIDVNGLFSPEYGSIIIEVGKQFDLDKELPEINYCLLGHTTEEYVIDVNGVRIDIEEVYRKWCEPLEEIFPTNVSESKNDKSNCGVNTCEQSNEKYVDSKDKKHLSILSSCRTGAPRVMIPVFPGTNCEYDSKRAFEKAGAIVETVIFNNLNSLSINESIDRMIKVIKNSQIIMIPGGFSAGDEPDGSGKFIATVFRNPKMKEAVMELIKNRDGLMLGICNGFQALIKLGLVPYGEIRDIDDKCPTLTYNNIGRHVSCMVNTKIISTKSPWFNCVKVGDIHTIPVSHGEGRFVANDEIVQRLFSNGQIATQYVDLDGNPTYDVRFNPNGSICAIEGITSPDGRILGKMGHSERIGSNVAKNIIGNKNQSIFESGVNYFK
ncbi:phosphoribosylformylglycinamidine synthase [Clostridium tepidiprofundi DSM 19306]|uniref:Phosphoribosylformylglycinamidine synthase n=1 Tax=Clostridium tepidiprofundi DSM 19306 TaxID=1121338 RepID=A0A151B3F6_9CLOT|nr:phosphoribosylformylglycinamidine synthase [Clostridium tepidiprofundi]KYH34320.1 phosphoribosylformylglycinamidine synthase [Clostridium tepidiprofundi DSM 19306]